MINVFDVADYILKSIGGEISAMKLQKLCYYSQAWTLAWDGKELFPEEFLRWANGPVCKELFDIHRGMFFASPTIIDPMILSGNEFSKCQLRNIDQILEEYGRYAGSDLSEMTHREKPWLKTPKDEVISKELMKEYYSGLIANAKKTKKNTCPAT